MDQRKRDLDQMKTEYQMEGHPSIKVLAYYDDMYQKYSKATSRPWISLPTARPTQHKSQAELRLLYELLKSAESP